MTMGRSNSVGSDTRMIVFWNVERAPNSGKNCFGCTSRDAGHSRVPAPPHMMSGTILPSIDASTLCGCVAKPNERGLTLGQVGSQALYRVSLPVVTRGSQ